MRINSLSVLSTIAIVFAITLSVYWLTSELVVLTANSVYLLGLDRADAVMIGVMLGFIYGCILLLWAFSITPIQKAPIYLLVLFGCIWLVNFSFKAWVLAP